MRFAEVYVYILLLLTIYKRLWVCQSERSARKPKGGHQIGAQRPRELMASYQHMMQRQQKSERPFLTTLDLQDPTFVGLHLPDMPFGGWQVRVDIAKAPCFSKPRRHTIGCALCRPAALSLRHGCAAEGTIIDHLEHSCVNFLGHVGSFAPEDIEVGRGCTLQSNGLRSRGAGGRSLLGAWTSCLASCTTEAGPSRTAASDPALPSSCATAPRGDVDPARAALPRSCHSGL